MALPSRLSAIGPSTIAGKIVNTSIRTKRGYPSPDTTKEAGAPPASFTPTRSRRSMLARDREHRSQRRDAPCRRPTTRGAPLAEGPGAPFAPALADTVLDPVLRHLSCEHLRHL